MAKLEGYFLPKKERIYVRGFGLVNRKDFNDDHYKALVNQCGNEDRAQEHLEFIKKKAVVKKATGASTVKGVAHESHEIPNKTWNKERIIDFLNDKDVEFDLDMKKDELLDLCVPNEKWTADQLRLFATVNEIEIDGVKEEELLKFIEEQIYE